MRFGRWRRVLAVLKDARPMIGIAVLGLAAACVLGWFVSWYLSKTFSDAVRYAGTMLQLFGIGMVAWRVGRLFTRLAAAFATAKPTTLQPRAGELITVGEDVQLIHRAEPGTSLEQRVSILEENINHLRQELDTKDQRRSQELAGVKESIQRESEERKQEDQRTARMIEEVDIGKLHLEAVGVFWLILGVLGTSIPEEITARLSFGCVQILR